MQVVGICLDDEECRRAAASLLKHMRRVESDMERAHQKRLAAQRQEADEARALNERVEAERRATKKKTKEAARKTQQQPHAQNAGDGRCGRASVCVLGV